MRVVVEKKACLRSGQCSYLHPAVFQEGADGYPIVLIAEPAADQLKEAEEAAEICPGSAIRIESGGAA